MAIRHEKDRGGMFAVSLGNTRPADRFRPGSCRASLMRVTLDAESANRAEVLSTGRFDTLITFPG